MTVATVLKNPPYLSVSGLGAGVLFTAHMRYRERKTMVVIHIRPQIE